MDDRDTSRKQYDMDTVTTPMDEWNRLPWKPMQRQVFRLKSGSIQASKLVTARESKSFHRWLFQSCPANGLQYRKETQTNRARKQPGWTASKRSTHQSGCSWPVGCACPRKRAPRGGCGYPSPARRTSADWGYR